MARVLVVDDEEDICDYLKRVLENMGLEVTFTLLGEDALKWIEKTVWDMAIVDLKLSSRVSGLHVIKALRDKSQHTVVVAMSGYIDAGLRQEAERLGVSDFLEKPGDIGSDVFTQKIKDLLSKIA